MASSALQGAMKGLVFNMSVLLIFRVLTFILTGLMIRYLSNEALGVINVRLLLLYFTSLLLSHDALRKASLSGEGDKDDVFYWRKVTNLLWTAVPTALSISLVFGTIWIFLLERPSETVTPYYSFAVLCMVLCVVIENIAEPLFVISQAFMFVKIRSFVDLSVMFIRIGVIFGLMVAFPNHPAEAFSVGFLSGSIALCALYYSSIYYYLHISRSPEKQPSDFPFKSLWDMLPRKDPAQPWFNQEQVGLLRSFFKQIILKQLLIDGEKYIITAFAVLSLADQGEYDAVTNIGMMTCKMILFPIEESAYLYFSKSLKRGLPVVRQDQKQFKETITVFHLFLRFLLLLGLLFITFSQAYAQPILFAFGGVGLTGGRAITIFRLASFNVSLLTIVTVTENYCLAAMNQRQVDGYNRSIAFMSVVYLTLCYFLASYFGGSGLILANCISILLRMWKNVQFLQEHYDNSGYKPWRALIPDVTLIGWLLTILATTLFSLRFLTSHVMIGVISLIFTLIAFFYKEIEIFQFFGDAWKTAKLKST